MELIYTEDQIPGASFLSYIMHGQVQDNVLILDSVTSMWYYICNEGCPNNVWLQHTSEF